MQWQKLEEKLYGDHVFACPYVLRIWAKYNEPMLVIVWPFYGANGFHSMTIGWETCFTYIKYYSNISISLINATVYELIDSSLIDEPISAGN